MGPLWGSSEVQCNDWFSFGRRVEVPLHFCSILSQESVNFTCQPYCWPLWSGYLSVSFWVWGCPLYYIGYTVLFISSYAVFSFSLLPSSSFWACHCLEIPLGAGVADQCQPGQDFPVLLHQDRPKARELWGTGMVPGCRVSLREGRGGMVVHVQA